MRMLSAACALRSPTGNAAMASISARTLSKAASYRLLAQPCADPRTLHAVSRCGKKRAKTGPAWTLSSATEDTAILRCDPPLEEAGSSKGALTGGDLVS